MIGNFDLAKTVKHCLRKRLRGTGYQHALLKTKVFHIKIIEAVISRSHYGEGDFVGC